MTIIIDNKDWWVQSSILSLDTPASAGVHITFQLTLDRPGRYVGHSFVIQGVDGFVANFDQYPSYIVYEGTASLPFTYGQSLTTIRFRLNQLDATARTVTFALLLFMKR